MKITYLALAIAMAGLSSNAAKAASEEWDGFYLGANIGNVDGSSDVTTSTVYSPTGYFATTSVPAIAAAGAGSVDPSGFTGGLTAGFNVQQDNIVFGLEADFNSMNADDSRTASAAYPCCVGTGFTVSQKTSVSNLFTFRARMGVAHNNSLFYVTAGWAQAKLEMDDTFTDTFAAANESFKDSSTTSGLVYGAGYEHSFGNNWSMKVEYLYADLGNLSGSSDNLTVAGPVSYPTNVFTHTTNDLQIDMLRIGVNYRF